MTLLRSRRPADPEVARAWPLIAEGLTHQGSPRHHLSTMIAILAGTSSTAGWDEFGLDVLADHVTVSFLQDEVCCSRAVLLAELSALR
ncbi:hypothetical protein [Actinoplanes sp. NPDC051859]|uniref:hypothetical protein n=1 Tax=Actinoplanes sp. NPDC051859 TaxID=3363909 RepID=UPI0037A4D3FE